MSASKQRGTAFETQVVCYLADNGFPQAMRMPLSGTKDRGDIANVPGWTFECKNVKQLNLAGWVDEAAVEAVNNRTTKYAVIHKRRGKGLVGDQYATLPVSVLVQLINEATFGSVPQPQPQFEEVDLCPPSPSTAA